jgi:hypothetical protein
MMQSLVKIASFSSWPPPSTSEVDSFAAVQARASNPFVQSGPLADLLSVLGKVAEAGVPYQQTSGGTFLGK